MKNNDPTLKSPSRGAMSPHMTRRLLSVVARLCLGLPVTEHEKNFVTAWAGVSLIDGIELASPQGGKSNAD